MNRERVDRGVPDGRPLPPQSVPTTMMEGFITGIIGAGVVAASRPVDGSSIPNRDVKSSSVTRNSGSRPQCLANVRGSPISRSQR